MGVAYLALSPRPPEAINTGWDKSNHLLAFGVLTTVGLAAWPNRNRNVLLGLVGYGCLIEVLQWFTPYREAAWLDIFADALGVLAGALVAATLRRSRLI
jgi:VanZ family protein